LQSRLPHRNKERQAPFTLVSYPNAGHGFNLAVAAYRAEDDADAWKRTLDMLRRYVRHEA